MRGPGSLTCSSGSVWLWPLWGGSRWSTDPSWLLSRGRAPWYRHAPAENKPRPCRRSLAQRIGAHGRCTKGPVAAEQASAAGVGAWRGRGLRLGGGGFLRNSAAAAPDAEARAAQGGSVAGTGRGGVW